VLPSDFGILAKLNNLSSHKTEIVREFLEQNPRVRFHFTPTYSSWLNQVEIWFGRIQRDVITRAVFTSVADLSRKLMKYIRAYDKLAKPFRWWFGILKWVLPQVPCWLLFCSVPKHNTLQMIYYFLANGFSPEPQPNLFATKSRLRLQSIEFQEGLVRVRAQSE
jgi:hypothetical protein